jgi:hypothetical protein
LPMVNDAHVSVVIQRHIARERQISSLVHRQVPGSSSPDVSLLSAGSVDSSCLCAVVTHIIRASERSLPINVRSAAGSCRFRAASSSAAGMSD